MIGRYTVVVHERGSTSRNDGTINAITSSVIRMKERDLGKMDRHRGAIASTLACLHEKIR